MIFPGFPGALSFFQVFQVEWEPCFNIAVNDFVTNETTHCLVLVVTELVMRGTYDNCGSISSNEGRFLPWSACVVSHGAVGDRSG